MRRIVLLLSMVSVPNMAFAQLSYTPLPPVPMMEPLYPTGDSPRYTPPPPSPRYMLPPSPRPAMVTMAPAAVPFSSPVASPPVALASVTRPVTPALAAPIVAAPIVAAPLPQPAAPAFAPVVVPTSLAESVIPPNTDVLVRLDQEVSSKGSKVGDSFKLTVVQDVMLNGAVVIRRGAPAFGTVAWRTGKGMFGKSAKMEISVDRLRLDGREVPLFGRFREEGEGNTGATIGTAIAAGLIAAAFVTGGSAVFPAGREFRVSTRQENALAAPVGGSAPALVTAARR
jgi:hypothetical protein